MNQGESSADFSADDFDVITTDAKASYTVSYSGNDAKVTVTAEDGTQVVYHVYVVD